MDLSSGDWVKISYAYYTAHNWLLIGCEHANSFLKLGYFSGFVMLFQYCLAP